MGKSSKVFFEDEDGKRHSFWKSRANVSPRATRFRDKSDYSRKNLQKELKDRIVEFEVEIEEVLRCENSGELCGEDLAETLDCSCRNCLLWQDRNEENNA